MHESTEIRLLGELRTNLTDFRKTVTADLAKAIKDHETECSRQINQRTARGPMGAADGPRSSAANSRVLLADSAEFRNWLSQPRSSRSSFACEIPFTHEKKVGPVLNAGGTTYMPGVGGPPQPALRLAELLPHIPVSSGAAVSWTKETSFTPAADVVPEGTLKPASDLTFQNVVTPFTTVATITKASVQSLSDVPALQSWIDSRLAYAVLLKQETVLLNDSVSGLIAAAQPLAPAYAPATGATTLDVIGSALGQLSSAGFAADGIVLAGADVNKARLLKTSTGEYVWSSPDSSLGTTQMWGVPTIISPSLTAGSFLVGAFGESTILFDRQTMTIDISYENEDDFVKNLCTIRAELRSALAIPVPAGLVKGSLTVAGATATK